MAKADHRILARITGLRFPRSVQTQTVMAAGVVLGLCAGMGLPNLGQRLLWQDEAETAVIARNVRRFGLPRVYDGRNLVTTDPGRDFNANYLLTSKPWLPYYLVAGSQSVLGETNLTCRLPFVLCVAAAILWLNLALRRVSTSCAWFGTGYMLTSVPLWLFARQTRYYGLVILFTVGTMDLYLRWLYEDRDKWRPAAWVAPWVLLAHTHYLSALYVGAGMATHFGATQRLQMRYRGVTLTLAAAALGVGPWLVYTAANQWFHLGKGSARPDFTAPVPELLVSVVVPLILPVALLTILAGLCSRFALERLWREPWVQLAWVTLATTLILHEVIGGLKLAPPFTRYVVALFPCYAVLFGAAAVALARWRPSLCLLAIGLLHFTSATGAMVNLIVGKGSPLYDPSARRSRVPLWSFCHELSSTYQGPLDCVLAELSARGRPADTMFIEFEAEPIIWYTHLRVLRELPFSRPPNWIMLRGHRGGTLQFVLLRGLNPAASPTRALPWWRVREDDLVAYLQANHDYVVRYIHSHPYQRIETSCADEMIQDCPELTAHRFMSEPLGPGVSRAVLYHLLIPGDQHE